MGAAVRAPRFGTYLLHGRLVEVLRAGAVRARPQVLPALLGHLPARLVALGRRYRHPVRRTRRGRAGHYRFEDAGGSRRPRLRAGGRDVRAPAQRTALRVSHARHPTPRAAPVYSPAAAGRRRALGGSSDRSTRGHELTRPAALTSVTPRKAVRIHNYERPEVGRGEEGSPSEPRSGELLIRVHAAGVNAADWMIRAVYLRQMIRAALAVHVGRRPPRGIGR